MPLTTDKQILATSEALVTDLRAAFHTPETDRPGTQPLPPALKTPH